MFEVPDNYSRWEIYDAEMEKKARKYDQEDFDELQDFEEESEAER